MANAPSLRQEVHLCLLITAQLYRQRRATISPDSIVLLQKHKTFLNNHWIFARSWILHLQSNLNCSVSVLGRARHIGLLNFHVRLPSLDVSLGDVGSLRKELASETPCGHGTTSMDNGLPNARVPAPRVGFWKVGLLAACLSHGPVFSEDVKHGAQPS